jgi:hypothetical protein
VRYVVRPIERSTARAVHRMARRSPARSRNRWSDTPNSCVAAIVRLTRFNLRPSNYLHHRRYCRLSSLSLSLSERRDTDTERFIARLIVIRLAVFGRRGVSLFTDKTIRCIIVVVVVTYNQQHNQHQPHNNQQHNNK